MIEVALEIHNIRMWHITMEDDQLRELWITKCPSLESRDAKLSC